MIYGIVPCTLNTLAKFSYCYMEKLISMENETCYFGNNTRGRKRMIRSTNDDFQTLYNYINSFYIQNYASVSSGHIPKRYIQYNTLRYCSAQSHFRFGGTLDSISVKAASLNNLNTD